MKGRVALYGFGGGSGGSGAALTVNAPAGVTVTVSKDGKSKNKTANSSGIAVFKGLSTGEWTVTITDGEKTASKPVTIIADFNKTITFFSATIHVTYPAGSKCTATDGVTTLTAPDTSGTWDCVVPNAGTWTVSEDGIGISDTCEIMSNGQEEHINLCELVIFRSGKLRDGLTLNLPTGAASTLSISGDDLVAKDDPDGKFGFYIDPKIDVTQWSCLRFSVTSKTKYWSYMGLSDSTSVGGDDGSTFDASAKTGSSAITNKTFDVDISKISGNKYIKLSAYSNISCVYKVHEILLIR